MPDDHLPSRPIGFKGHQAGQGGGIAASFACRWKAPNVKAAGPSTK